jgi:hypothetical protein
MLPDDYVRKMKRDLAESDALVQSRTRYVLDPDVADPLPDCRDELPPDDTTC